MVSKNPSADEVQGWGPSEVAEWLAQVGLEDCARFFQDRNVSGAELLTLDESQLFRWQDLPIKRRRDVAKQIETLKLRKQEKKSTGVFSGLFSKKGPQLPSRDYQPEPTSPVDGDDDGWDSDEFEDTLTAMRQDSYEWQECIDDNGFPYYWNIVTNVTSWDKPDKFWPAESGSAGYDEGESDDDQLNDYEPPPDAVSPTQPAHSQPPHRRQPMPIPSESAEDQETYEVPDHNNDSDDDYEEPVDEQQPPVPQRPHQVNRPAQQTRPPVRVPANNFNVSVGRPPPVPGQKQKPSLQQPEDTYEEFADNAGPEEEYEMPVQGGPEDEYEVPDSESFSSSGHPSQSTGPPVPGRKPLPPPPDEEPPPALPPKPTKSGPTAHITPNNKVLPNPTPDTRPAPKLPPSAKWNTSRPPSLPSPSTKPESPFTSDPPQYPVKPSLVLGQKPGVGRAKFQPSDMSSNVKPSQLKNVGRASSSPQPSPPVPKWKQTPPAVPSQNKPAKTVQQLQSRQQASKKSPEQVKSKVSGLASMFENQNLPMSPGLSPPSIRPKNTTPSPRDSTISTASSSSADSRRASSGSGDSLVNKRASASSNSSASGDSIHDELLPGQRPGGPGGVPALPGQRIGKHGAPPPPPISSMPSTNRGKSRGMKNRQLPPPPTRGGHGPPPPSPGARGPPPPPIQSKKPASILPEPEPLQGGLYEYPWYHGEVDQKPASAALRENGKNGAFLVRKSTRDPSAPYTLSLIYQHEIKKVKIRYRSDQKYALGTEKEDEDTFYSVPDLIEFHQAHEILLSQGGKTVLTEAVFKNY